MDGYDPEGKYSKEFRAGITKLMEQYGEGRKGEKTSHIMAALLTDMMAVTAAAMVATALTAEMDREAFLVTLDGSVSRFKDLARGMYDENHKE